MSHTIIDESGSCTTPRVRDAWGWPRQEAPTPAPAFGFQFPHPVSPISSPRYPR
jgi:hypothetical protein